MTAKYWNPGMIPVIPLLFFLWWDSSEFDPAPTTREPGMVSVGGGSENGSSIMHELAKELVKTAPPGIEVPEVIKEIVR